MAATTSNNQITSTIASKQKDPANSRDLMMQVKVYSPFKVYFDAPAKSVSAENETGPFDILPHHHNFITLLKAGDVLIRPPRGDDQRVRISGGVMHVKSDVVLVFLDI